MTPGSPQTEYIRNKLIADTAPEGSKEQKDAQDWVSNFEAAERDITSARTEGSVSTTTDNTPEGRIKLWYEEQMNVELAELDKQIDEAKHSLSYATGPRAVSIRSTIKELENKKRKVVRKWTRRMRHVNKGVSGGVSVLGNGVNMSS